MKTDSYFLYESQGVPVLKTYHSKVKPSIRIYREHYHTECEFCMILSGSGKYVTSHKEYNFTAGDVFLFGGNEVHCITEIYSDLDLLNVHFEPRLLWEHPDGNMLLSLFFARNSHFSNLFRNEKNISDKILSIEKELIHAEIGYRAECKHILFSILIYILRKYDYIHKAEYTENYQSTAKKLKQTLSYIDENLDRKIQLSDLAHIACMSETYFSTTFKKYNGVSPWDYISIKRVEKAISLLKSTNMNKLEIAESCGFSSSSNFYKIFSKITGKTPSEYIT